MKKPEDLIGGLYERYMRGELTLDAAAEQIFAIMQGHSEPSGLAVILDGLSPADQARTAALFDRVVAETGGAVLPDRDMPPSQHAEPKDSDGKKGNE